MARRARSAASLFRHLRMRALLKVSSACLLFLALCRQKSPDDAAVLLDELLRAYPERTCSSYLLNSTPDTHSEL